MQLPQYKTKYFTLAELFSGEHMEVFHTQSRAQARMMCLGGTPTAVIGTERRGQHQVTSQTDLN